MVAQVEHPWEAASGVGFFGPKSMIFLVPQQPFNAACDGRMIHPPCGHKSQNRPGGLRGDRGSLFITPIIEAVAVAALAPSAVRVLNRDQPVGSAADHWRVQVEPRCIQSREYRPCAIDVIHAPAAEPAAVLFLRTAQIFDGGSKARPVGGVAELREHTDASRRYIGRRRI